MINTLKVYKIKDMSNGNVFYADRFVMATALQDQFDTDQDGVMDAIDNICDCLFGRSSEPMWGPDFLNVLISEYEGNEI